MFQTCIYCGNNINCEDGDLHNACAEFYEFLLDEMIDKLKIKLEILLAHKLIILKSKYT
jgi:hypothetical protein